MDITFNTGKTFGIMAITLTTNAYMMTDFPDNKNYMANSSLSIQYDFTTNIIQGNGDFNSNLAPGITATAPFDMRFDIVNKKWHITLGNPYQWYLAPN